MSNYVSDYSGSQIDNIIGLFNGKGLNQVTGLVQRNADGTFSQGSGGGVDVFVVTPNTTTYNQLLAAIQAGKYLCIHSHDNSENCLYWISFAEIGADAIVINFATANGKIKYLVSDSNIWTEQYDYEVLTNNSLNNYLKTVNNQSLVGSGNITVSTTAARIVRW